MNRLQISQIDKWYGNQRALQDITLQINQGVLGLLGPNGAGKSTLMRIVATISQPSSGQVLWDGHELTSEPDRLRNVLGYLPQHFGIYPKLTAREFLRYLAAAKGLKARERIEQLLVLVNLQDAADRRLESYSGGMKQRVGIAQALLNDPELLIVDEPTVGLDPEERARFRNLLSELAGDRIVILSTHIVSDVEATADRIAILKGGRLLTDTRPEEMLEPVAGHVWNLTIDSSQLPDYRNRYTVTSAAHRTGGTKIRLISDSAPSPGAEPADPSLEDAYLWLMRQDPSQNDTNTVRSI